ncbi:hypothetical protein [Halobacterium litoreum]|uniref:Restriction endonuclease n=1 Tax=Halobacterium litoreum TaxID=2039234 RepID=A0ABD5NDC1_9EURY|nr:hypothetical protein [Halobacterium litoreum]UHH14033.1 hypothetical protein LT972_03305 [Halobacterium litoreum]
MISDEEYASDLVASIDVDRYATLVQSVGNQLNGRKDRFDKSDIIERCLEVYTDGRLEWVDDEGRDFVDTKYGCDVEFKYESDMLFTNVRKDERDPNPRLHNSLGTNEKDELPNPAEFYLLGQQDAIGVVSYGVFADDSKRSRLVQEGDAFIGDLYTEDIAFLFTPEDVDDVDTVDVNYKERKMEMQMELIQSI